MHRKVGRPKIPKAKKRVVVGVYLDPPIALTLKELSRTLSKPISTILAELIAENYKCLIRFQK